MDQKSYNFIKYDSYKCSVYCQQIEYIQWSLARMWFTFRGLADLFLCNFSVFLFFFFYKSELCSTS